jgi:hypothetical protein
LKNKKILKGLNYLTQTFDNPGIAEIKFESEGKLPESIKREDREYFKSPESELEEEKLDTDIFLITRPDFRGRRKGWRFSFGHSDERLSQINRENDFPVTILDDDFLRRVRREQIVISQGTKIIAQYRKTVNELERLTVHWEILKVIKIESDESRNRELSDFISIPPNK